eukprot:m.76854 g.76854  ORF g.76854 m.76854 type:complete len:210 (+) comp14442_c2_seq9:184-813(+)
MSLKIRMIGCVFAIWLVASCTFIEALANKGCQSEHGPVLVYNKVPKAGSTTMSKLLQSGSRRRFKVALNQSMRQNRPFDATQELQAIKDILAKRGQIPLAHHQHSRWLDFAKHGYDKPLYINLVREPIARFTSMYYFQTQTMPKGQFVRNPHSPIRQQRDWTINKCADQPTKCWFSGPSNVSMLNACATTRLTLALASHRLFLRQPSRL